ncbi:hypothetical protein MLD38_002005 [Melastoma candidum]|uniref:Uncharacterized protein n=1 Tax=Melastoma candidum TaxID=119954 RepID=A0ACB9SJZ8_9MYRT|nr:hypothetical protein MLD38_002005 [Melastoma candidum]
MKSSSRRKSLEVFDLREEDELLEAAAAHYLEKFKAPAAVTTSLAADRLDHVSKYEILECGRVFMFGDSEPEVVVEVLLFFPWSGVRVRRCCQRPCAFFVGVIRCLESFEGMFGKVSAVDLSV